MLLGVDKSKRACLAGLTKRKTCIKFYSNGSEKTRLSYLDPNNRVCLSYLESYANGHEMRKILAAFHGSVAQAVGGMMFIVAVLMLAFLIFVHELGHFTIAQANDSYA